MTTMSALEAKNSFGKFLEAASRAPVTLTKNNREIAALFSMEDMKALAEEFLAEPIKQDLDGGRMSFSEALMAQIDLNKRLRANREALAEGRGVRADAEYFDGLRARVSARMS